MGAMRFVFSVFINWQCNVEHNDDAIRKITSPVFCCLVDNPTVIKFCTPKYHLNDKDAEMNVYR